METTQRLSGAGESLSRSILGIVLVIIVCAGFYGISMLIGPPDGVRLADGVVRAPEGYEAATVKYVVANPTDIYSTHFVYGGKVVGELARGTPVDALAKVKGYDWIVVGTDGIGIGYVPTSLLEPANDYAPGGNS